MPRRRQFPKRAGRSAFNGDLDTAKTQSPAIKLTAVGRVVAAEGRPVAGANVFVREWTRERATGIKQEESEKLYRGQEIPDILASGKTDQEGRFRFQDVPAPTFPHNASAGATNFPWDVLAIAPGHGVAWSQLTPQIQRSEITLTLPAEGIMRGRLVEPGGSPIAGARVKVFGIDRLGLVDANGLGTDGHLNLLWTSIPLATISGPDGTFTLRGLPRDIVATLVITGSRHERTVIHAATTNEPQPEITHRMHIQDQTVTTKERVHGADFTVTLKATDHRLIGRVVFAATGKPAAGAELSIGHRLVARADTDGKFQVETLAAGEIELHVIAWKTDAPPLDTRITLPDEPKTVEREFALPPGLVVTGRAVDQESGSGIGDVELIYRPRTGAGQPPTIYGFLAKTESDGRFRLVVPPGPGALEVWKLPSAYPQPRESGTNAAHRVVEEFNGKPGGTVEGVVFRLTKGLGITLVVLDPQGIPVAGALVHRRGVFGAEDGPGRTDAAGRCELAGIEPKNGFTFDVVHPTEPLGARLVIRPEDPEATDRGRIFELKLQPTGSLAGRVLDEQGKPINAPVIQLFTDVEYPQRMGDTVTNTSDVTNDGSFTFDRLIAGASYSVQVTTTGHASVLTEHVRVKPGESVHLPDIRLPITDKELRGVVVDPRGRPVAGANVAFQRDSKRQLVPPRSGRWFQETDGQGRFHLTDLPRGTIKLMAYRSPGADRSIRNPVRVEFQSGQADVRIVLPDPNERLRGIE